MSWSVAIKGQPVRPGSKTMGLDANVVSPGYFEALGIQVISGRTFARTDTEATPPVAIVSERLARSWPDGRALGGALTSDPDVPSPKWMTVIGVVKDIRRTLSRDPDPTVYVPAAQNSNMLDFAGSHLVVRSSLAPDAALDATVRTLRDVDANLPITAKATMAEHLRATLMSQRLGATLFTLFASVALTLTALGLYGVIAYAVAHRAREIGIRRALGADRASVLRLVGRQGLTPIAAGLAAGGVASVWAGRAVEQFLFKLPALSVAAFATLAVIVAGIAALAMIVPARRALAVDPAATLRNE
jgi:ABC-type lipoprotein release transport system permease subunit